MVLPLPLGTLLRQRYLIQEVLGQGGFGRTYLALDQERFNDRCVIKEFVVPYHDEALIEKSRTLFQREASILYQIQHPQVPRFWASFEDEQRLFLVQDFVEGQTYRRLLSDRKQHGQSFSEVEVQHFLVHLLPVLSYIHDRDIIHRDISLENVILKPQALASVDSPFPAQTGLPILLDFGAVKEATSHWPLMSAITRVGKVGYAPPEQLQTGKVYPNSDLYALAASSLVLLTGREPQTLLDSRTLSWRWQAYASVSEELGMILRKMLAVYPGDRYQSAHEVLADLEPVLQVSPASTLVQPAPSNPMEQVTDYLKEATTAHSNNSAVVTPRTSEPLRPSRREQPAKSLPPTIRRRNRGSERASNRSKLRLAVAASFLTVLGVAVPFAWHVWGGKSDSRGEVWVSGTKLPQSEVSRIIGSQGMKPTNSALNPRFNQSDRSSPPLRSGQPQLIEFAPGKISAVFQGNLRDTNSQSYLLKAVQGQIMTASLEGTGVTMNLLSSNQEAINSAAYGTRSWTGQIPADDRYIIQVSGSGAYALDVAVTPLSRPTQEQTQKIAFTPGQTGTTVTGQLVPKQLHRYLLGAKQGQLLAIKVLQGTVSFSAIAPNGQRIGGSATDSKNWQGRLPSDGDYIIEVTTQQASKYALAVEIF